jgi:4-hydroxy-tetrahydrodipicolinate synthase
MAPAVQVPAALCAKRKAGTCLLNAAVLCSKRDVSIELKFMTHRLAGVFPAVWTPTDPACSLLISELRANLDFLKSHGVHGFMALGSTGEFPLLDPRTRRQVLEEIAAAAGALPVVANISDVRPAVVEELGRVARQIGAAAIAVLPPYFYHVSQSDLVEFFVRAADTAELPLVLYNFPERTGIRIELETIAAVAERTQVAAVKHSGDDFAYHAPLVKLGREKNFVVFTGADTSLSEALALGACGTISGIGNALPDMLGQIFLAHQNGAADQARVPAQRMKRVGELLNRLWFPLNISALMTARGLAVGQAKEIISPATRERHAQLVEELKALFQQWNLS